MIIEKQTENKDERELQKNRKHFQTIDLFPLKEELLHVLTPENISLYSFSDPVISFWISKI